MDNASGDGVGVTHENEAAGFLHQLEGIHTDIVIGLESDGSDLGFAELVGIFGEDFQAG